MKCVIKFTYLERRIGLGKIIHVNTGTETLIAVRPKISGQTKDTVISGFTYQFESADGSPFFS
jgi:hypothetical protein